MHSPPPEIPLVTIVIICYKQAHLLAEAVESALAQTHPRVEVVVVDDGSPDDPGAVVARYPGVRLVRKANGGISSARNAGWRAGHGEYLVFLDADDLLLPNAAAVGARVLAEHPACAFVHGLCDRRRLDGTFIETRPAVVGAHDFYHLLLQRNCVRGVHSVTFRRTALEAVDGFNERQRHGQDWELYLRLTRRFPAYGHGELVGSYRRHEHNVNSRGNSARMLVDSLAVLRAERPHVRGNPRHAAALRDGERWVRGLHGSNLVARVAEHVRERRWRAALREGTVLARHHPRGLLGRCARAIGLAR